MKKFTVMALALTLCLGAAAQAANVHYTLYLGVDPVTNALSPGNFALTCEVTGGSFGLASYGVELIGDPSVATGSILTADHEALRLAAAVTPQEGSAGFTLLRSADLTAAQPDAAFYNLSGSQNTVDPTTNIVYGYGQTAGTLLQRGITPAGTEGDPFAAAPVLLLGTYVPTSATTGLGFLPQATAATFANVFLTASDGSTEAATTTFEVVAIPEPATLAMAGMGLIGMVMVSRRRSA